MVYPGAQKVHDVTRASDGPKPKTEDLSQNSEIDGIRIEAGSFAVDEN